MVDFFTGIFTNFGVVLGSVIALILALLIFAVYALLAVLGLILAYAILKALLFWICRFFAWVLPSDSDSHRLFVEQYKRLR